MPEKSHFPAKDDVELLRSWREWRASLVDAEMAAADQGTKHRRERVEMLQRTIAGPTPSEGLVGLGVKLALASFLDSFANGADGEPARSAYLDTVRLLGRDFSAEAEAVVERSKETGSRAHLAPQPSCGIAPTYWNAKCSAGGAKNPRRRTSWYVRLLEVKISSTTQCSFRR